jgi:hypothetical protein
MSLPQRRSDRRGFGAGTAHLRPGVLQALRGLHEITLCLEEKWRNHLTPVARPNTTRTRLVRGIVMLFAEGDCMRISHWERALSGFASASKVRSEIKSLRILGILDTKPHPYDSRALVVVPTDRTIRFFNEHTPQFRVTLNRKKRVIKR